MAIIKKRETELERGINKKYYTLFMLFILTIFFLYTIKVLAIVTGILLIIKINSARLQMEIKGAEGEAYTRMILKNLDDTYSVFCDIEVMVNGKKSQLDTIVVGDNGVFIIESKNINGKVKGDYKDKNIMIEKIGRRGTKYTRNMYNPCKQVKTHTYRLAEYLQNQDIRCVIEGIVLFKCDYRIFGKEQGIDIKNTEGIVFDNGEKLLEKIESNNYKIRNKKEILKAIEKLI